MQPSSSPRSRKSVTTKLCLGLVCDRVRVRAGLGLGLGLESKLAQYAATVAFYRQLKRELNTFLTVPDPYWNSGGTNREPAGYSDAWNLQIPQTDQGNLEYLQTARMYLYDSNHSLHPSPTPSPSPNPN